MNGDGTLRETAILFGDPTKHDLYGILTKWPPRTTLKAHSHPDDRYIMVLSGIFYHGYGNKFDATKLERHTTRHDVQRAWQRGSFRWNKRRGSSNLYPLASGPTGPTRSKNRNDRIVMRDARHCAYPFWTHGAI